MFILASLSPSAVEAVALSTEGTPVVVAPDAFTTRVANLFKVLATLALAVLLLAPALSFKTEVSGHEPLTLEVNLILEMEEGLNSSVGELGMKKADLVSFKIFANSSSFIFLEMSSAYDSLFALEVAWAVFNPSIADLVLSTRTLRLDPARSALTVKSAKASCLDADSECKIKEVDQADVGPPTACYASLCISPTIVVGGEGWCGLVSIAKLDFISFFEWPDWDLDASVVDLDMCFKDCFLLSLLLAPGFLP
uniref:Uncharacterized protein n=1 Tax=Tanacetum cinerariifolium TaxID=118510 RepID=A0A699H6Y3_TANCI|nr:hypothetical protein [Tanacetum cinerariifolium]